VGVVFITLLIISRWMFLAVHGLFLVYLYQRSRNRGLLIAGAIMIGLSAGILAEEVMSTRERLTSAAGIGLALIVVTLLRHPISHPPIWLLAVLGMVYVLLAAVLWTAPEDTHAIFLKAYPAVVVLAFALSALQIWRDWRAKRA
jgi:hypothetical protein